MRIIGIKSHIIVPAKMSVVRCTVVQILQRTVIIAIKKRKYAHIDSFLFLCLCAINRVPIAIENVTTAWSDGKDVDGRKL
jgi:hypothetical protein